MKKVTVALSLLFVLCLSVAASAAAPIKIGYLAALTGDYAAYGMTEVN
ncbi:MAG: ABC transporter substrate-binding protein, partial [Synergistaceae bacterium]|nr:ABC transporter substrate-binding protein [Synergistaceae bacterium]